MKKLFFATALMVLVNGRSYAGFSFGVGNAAAKKTASVIQKAKSSSTSSVGSPSTSGACGSRQVFFSTGPVSISTITALTPMGNLSPVNHTFPTDHIFFNIYGQLTPLVAPGSANLISVTSITYVVSPGPPGPVQGSTEFLLEFSPCNEFDWYFDHVQALDSTLASQIGPMSNCATTSGGGTTKVTCSKTVQIQVSTGQALGLGANDWRAFDTRTTPLAYISPGKFVGSLYIVCPVDFMDTNYQGTSTPLKSAWQAKFNRSVVPVCGTVMQDVANTAQGVWYAPGCTSQCPESTGLALVHDNFAPSTGTFSVGSGVPTLSGNIYRFNPKTTADGSRINYDFNLLSSDGNVYCYNSFFDSSGNSYAAGTIILVQMPTSTTLNIEAKAAASCAAAGPPWSFSSPTNFQR